MRVDPNRLRSAIEDATAANSAVVASSAAIRRLRLDLSTIRARLDPVEGRPQDPQVLRGQESDLLAQIEAAEDNYDQLRDRWTVLGRIASNCREHARSAGVLPADLEV